MNNESFMDWIYSLFRSSENEYSNDGYKIRDFDVYNHRNIYDDDYQSNYENKFNKENNKYTNINDKIDKYNIVEK